MVKLTLINMREEIGKSKSYKIYKPTKILKKNYSLIFDIDKLNGCDKSMNDEFIQFILFVKFADRILISNGENETNYEIFPYNGISYSCVINELNNLSIQIKPLDLCTKIIIQRYITYPIKSLTLNYIIWDMIYIINLPRRTDRKKQMEKILFQSNISQYRFIEAYDGLDKNIKIHFNKLKENKKTSIITSGHFACLLSHIKAIEEAKKNKYSYIMILEDDVFFEPNIIQMLKNTFIPNFDLLYLGGITSKKKIFTKGWGFSNKTNIIGAYAYILSSTIFDIVLNGLKEFVEYVDFYYLKKIQQNYKTIILNDYIKTDLSSSDTSGKSKKMIKRITYIN